MKARSFLNSIDEWNGRGVLSIVGPTSSGKTSLALQWVRKNFPQNFKAPLLVSIDSIAVYSELDIGSAKPLGADRSDFDWIGLDLFRPTESATVKSFLESVFPLIVRAIKDARPVLLVGGSFFYERALVDGMSPGEKSDADFIASLASESNVTLHERLIARDARWREKIHTNDRYRLERYSDLALRQGLSFDALFLDEKIHSLSALDDLNLKTLVIGLEKSREDYLPQLAARIEDMFRDGWLEEVKNLMARYPNAPALESVGYAQIQSGLENGASMNKIKEEVLISHAQLVKKQKTWLRSLK